MTAGKYISRSVKYLIKLLILLAALFAFMMWSETSTLSYDNFIDGYFGSARGWLLTAALLLWSAVYPKVEFVSRHLDYDMHKGRIAVIKAFGAGNMVLSREEDGKMVFRGESAVRRLWFLWDDAVTVTPNPSGGFDMEGPRRFVGEAQQRIPGYMEIEKPDRTGGEEK